MPVFSKAELEAFTGRVFEGAGFPAQQAGLIGRLIVQANLCGHDSHGVRQIPRYLQRIDKGEIVPGATVEIVRESPTTAVLDGNRTLGHVAAARAMELAIAKARDAHICTVAVRNIDHIGRVGAYPEMAAEAGMVGMAFVGAQGPGRSVAPFGGIAGRLGTNPWSAAFPNRAGAPILLDFATSVVAANKIRQAHDRGEQTGEGWLIDLDGNPTRDPQLYLDGKAVLQPLGGGRGHKGYGLAVVAEILAAVLSGAGAAQTPREMTDNSTLFIVIDPTPFIDPEGYDAQLSALVDHLRATPTRPGDPPVQLPGDYEQNHRRKRESEGIHIEAPVWNNIQQAAEARQVPLPVPAPAAG